jgi:hypothetical protein
MLASQQVDMARRLRTKTALTPRKCMTLLFLMPRTIGYPRISKRYEIRRRSDIFGNVARACRDQHATEAVRRGCKKQAGLCAMTYLFQEFPDLRPNQGLPVVQGLLGENVACMHCATTL